MDDLTVDSTGKAAEGKERKISEKRKVTGGDVDKTGNCEQHFNSFILFYYK